MRFQTRRSRYRSLMAVSGARGATRNAQRSSCDGRQALCSVEPMYSHSTPDSGAAISFA